MRFWTSMADLGSMPLLQRAPSVSVQPKPPQSWRYVNSPHTHPMLTSEFGHSVVQRHPQRSINCGRSRRRSPRHCLRRTTRCQRRPQSCLPHCPRSDRAARPHPHLHRRESHVRVPHCGLQLYRCPRFPLPGQPRNVVFHSVFR